MLHTHMQSCRFAFAVHVMAVLANEDKCASSASLAETVNTNPVVIRRLLIDLQSAGLIRTARGPQGGAVLAKPAKSISLWQIHSAVESREMFGNTQIHRHQTVRSVKESGRCLGMLRDEPTGRSRASYR